MRLSLAVVLLPLAVGCTFYAPQVADCAVRCVDTGPCPGTMHCVEGLCRPEGVVDACACMTGQRRDCGVRQGECVPGVQTCRGDGTWSTCEGAILPGEERCDGKDNDCDGTVDALPARGLLLGPRDGQWRLDGLDAGFLLTWLEQEGDGGAVVRQAAFDATLGPGPAPRTLFAGAAQHLGTAAGPGLVWVAWGDRDGVAGLGTGAGALEVPLERAQVAGPAVSFHLGGGAAPMAVWLDADGGATLAGWSAEGRVTRQVDLKALAGVSDGGFAHSVNLSVDGRYVGGTFRSGEAGADPWRPIWDTGSLALLRPNAAYSGEWRGQWWVQPPGALVSVYDWVAPNEPKSGVYFSPDLLTQALNRELVLNEVSSRTVRYDAPDLTMDEQGRAVVVYRDLDLERLVLRASVGVGASAVIPTRRELVPGDFGWPQVAHVPGADMVAVAWSVDGGVSARLICPPEP